MPLQSREYRKPPWCLGGVFALMLALCSCSDTRTAHVPTPTPAPSSTASAMGTTTSGGQPVPAGFNTCSLATNKEVSTISGQSVTTSDSGGFLCQYIFQDSSHEISLAATPQTSSSQAKTLAAAGCLSGGQAIPNIGSAACLLPGGSGGIAAVGSNTVTILIQDSAISNTAGVITKLLQLVVPRVP